MGSRLYRLLDFSLLNHRKVFKRMFCEGIYDPKSLTLRHVLPDRACDISI